MEGTEASKSQHLFARTGMVNNRICPSDSVSRVLTETSKLSLVFQGSVKATPQTLVCGARATRFVQDQQVPRKRSRATTSDT